MRTVSTKPVPTPAETIAARIRQFVEGAQSAGATGTDDWAARAAAMGMIRAYAQPAPYGDLADLTAEQRLDAICGILAGYELTREADR